MGMEKQTVDVPPAEVNLGRGQAGIVTRMVVPYQPSIHAHLEDDVDKELYRGRILELDFSKSKTEKLKGMFYRAKK
jgi:hypothetical protein